MLVSAGDDERLVDTVDEGSDPCPDRRQERPALLGRGVRCPRSSIHHLSLEVIDCLAESGDDVTERIEDVIDMLTRRASLSLSGAEVVDRGHDGACCCLHGLA